MSDVLGVLTFAGMLFALFFGALKFYHKPKKKASRAQLIREAALYSALVTLVVLLLIVVFPKLRTIANQVTLLFKSPPKLTTVTDSTIKHHTFLDDNKIHILVVAFKEYGIPAGVSEAGITLSDFISTELHRASLDSVLQIEVGLLPATLAPYIQSHADAVWWGDTLNADIVVWGDLDPPLFIGQEYNIAPRLTFVRAIRGFGSNIDLRVIRDVSPRPLDINFPKQLVDTPHQLGLFLIGYSSYLKQHHDAAIAYFKKAIEHSDLQNEFSTHLNYYLGSSYFNKAHFTPGLPEYLKQGNILFSKAKTCFEDALAENPRNVYALNGLGATYFSQYEQNIEKALYYFLKASQIDSKALFVNSNLALTYSIIGKFDDAMKRHNKALDIIKSFPSEMPKLLLHQAMSNGGTIYIMGGNFAKAESVFVELRNQEPGNMEAFILASLCHVLWRQNKMDSAFQVILEASEKYPNSNVILSNLGILYLERKQYQKGLSFLKQGISTAPLHIYLVGAYALFGYYCIEANTDSARTYFNLIRNHLDKPLLSYSGLSTLEWILNGDFPPNGFDEKIVKSEMLLDFIRPYLDEVDIEKTNLKSQTNFSIKE